MKTISGSFDNRERAERAFSALLDKGFRQEDISLIMTDKARNTLFENNNETAIVEKNETTGDKAAKGGFAGAAAGGLLFALVGGLTAVGSIVIPGAGLLAVGPIIGALAAGGAGAATGGLLGALLAAGFAEDEAAVYEAELKAGRALIVVQAQDSQVATARSILRDAGATTKAA